ncbi:MAG: ABC-type multidrug transport system, ATPase component [Gemmatimonadetes bacterium]|nr:ABC-type multidrug transport system, ATPase component [Gemmatimonadota bacterium]
MIFWRAVWIGLTGRRIRWCDEKWKSFAAPRTTGRIFVVLNAVKDLLSSQGAIMNSTPALRVEGLRKAYGDVVAVDGLDLTVGAGECFGLLGPNGAGKTTTIEICEGLTEPDSGIVEVLGRRWDSDEHALRERLGVQLQETQLSEKLTVDETVNLFRSFYSRGRDVNEVIDVVQLGEKRSARVGKLSGGQKQRLALACAIVGDPELLFLDEPTTGLDPQSRRQLWDLIIELRASGRSVVLTTHYMDEAEKLCDRVAIVDHGRVIALGSPRELIASLGAEHVVEFTTPDAPANSLDASTLGQLDGVTAAREKAGRWTLEVSELARAVPALLAALTARHLVLGELATHSATLEDVFVSLTGRQLRDA